MNEGEMASFFCQVYHGFNGFQEKKSKFLIFSEKYF